MLNLPPAPPMFRGLHPDLPVTVYHRHLPHWRQQGATYFVTFRLADALPQSTLQMLKRMRERWERSHPEPRSEAAWVEHAKEVTCRVEAWLDEGYGTCHFRDPRWANDLRDRLHHFQDTQYRLDAWVVMPNHCHAVIRPFDERALEDILGAMKSASARLINAEHGLRGSLWQDESFDRIVRDHEHLWRVIQYIGRNPRHAGLPRAAWHRGVSDEWTAAGWGFRDDE